MSASTMDTNCGKLSEPNINNKTVHKITWSSPFYTNMSGGTYANKLLHLFKLMIFITPCYLHVLQKLMTSKYLHKWMFKPMLHRITSPLITFYNLLFSFAHFLEEKNTLNSHPNMHVHDCPGSYLYILVGQLLRRPFHFRFVQVQK